MKRILLALALILSAPFAYAVQPDEILDDPALEQRARDISDGLRCLVCRNESIDESNADLARDLRILVRERLTAGDTNEEVVDYVVDRYGEYVLLNPTTRGANMLLWLAGPIMLLLAVIMAVFYLRSRAKARPDANDKLTAEEEARLAELMKD